MGQLAPLSSRCKVSCPSFLCRGCWQLCQCWAPPVSEVQPSHLLALLNQCLLLCSKVNNST